MIEVRNARNADKEPPVERGEDGKFLDPWMDKLEHMTDEDFAEEAGKDW